MSAGWTDASTDLTRARPATAANAQSPAPVESTWRTHQVPLARVRENRAHLAQLEEWMRLYRPQELFDAAGRPVTELDGVEPTMSGG